MYPSGPVHGLDRVRVADQAYPRRVRPRGSFASAYLEKQCPILGFPYPMRIIARAPVSSHGALGYSNRFPDEIYTGIGRDFLVGSSRDTTSGRYALPAQKQRHYLIV